MMHMMREDYFKKFVELDQLQSEMTERLVRWAEINSGSHHLAGLAQMHTTIHELFSSLPGEIESIALADGTSYAADGSQVVQPLGRAFRMRCRPQAPKQILLNGHMDTVFGKDHPFQKARFLEDGKILNGPGAADMKGGLLIIYYALAFFEKYRSNDDLGWEVLIGPDEEIGTPGTEILLKEAAQRCQLACIVEPSLPDGSFSRARKGSGTFNAVVTGKPAHVGREFFNGRSAIAHLSGFICEMHQLNTEFSDEVCNVGHVHGGGPLNIVPDHAAAQFNIRVENADTVERVTQRINEIVDTYNQADGLSLSWEGGFTRPPKTITPEIEQLFTQIQANASALGDTISWKDTGGCCDGNNLAALGVPNVDTLGACGGNIHSDQEFVILDSLPKRSKLMASILWDVATQP